MRCLLVALLAIRVAHAQPGAIEAARSPPALLSEDKAMWLTVGGTVGAYALFFGSAYVVGNVEPDLGLPVLTIGFVGTLVAPSFGHWYARTWISRGLALRLGATATVAAASAIAFSCGNSHNEGTNEDCTTEHSVGLALGLIGAGLWVVGTFDDCIQAKRRVQRINESRLDASYSLVPTVTDEQLGLALVGRF